MIRWFQIGFLCIIVLADIIHAHKYNSNETVQKGFHFWWSVIYASPVVVIAIVFLFTIGWKESVWICLAAFFERIVIYNPLLNFLRSPQKKFFYISASSTTDPSWFDKLELRWKDSYPFAWITCLIIFIILQIVVPK